MRNAWFNRQKERLKISNTFETQISSEFYFVAMYESEGASIPCLLLRFWHTQ